MKKYFIFIFIFALLLFLFQLFSGLLLTMFYTPNFYLQKTSSDPATIFGKSTTMYLLGTLLIASFAYFSSQKLLKN
ncbi:hypothetical protein [Psychrobacillus sp. L3]|uniref:hypothetical protein n=1 Tax=Psychrobacillus sp. L3 TaxID=3236891 RepID=UPI0036F3EB1A